METATKPKAVKLGVTVSTATVSALIKKDPDFGVFVYQSLHRHRRGDWGDLSDEDKALNDAALTDDPELAGRIFSRFNYEKDRTLDIYIITEGDRSSTCILFPTEY